MDYVLVFLQPEKKLFKLKADGRVYEARARQVWREFGPHRRRDLVSEHYYKVVTSAALAQRVRDQAGAWLAEHAQGSAAAQ